MAMNEVGDEIDDLIEQVAGELEEVGAANAAARVRRKAASFSIGRPRRSNKRVAYLGFGAAASVLTTAQATFSDQVQRGFQPEHLVLVPSAIGFIVDSIKIGDEDMIVGTKSMVAEMFDKQALLTPPADFSPAPTGATVVVKVTNTTAGTLTCGASFKGTALN